MGKKERTQEKARASQNPRLEMELRRRTCVGSNCSCSWGGGLSCSRKLIRRQGFPQGAEHPPLVQDLEEEEEAPPEGEAVQQHRWARAIEASRS